MRLIDADWIVDSDIANCLGAEYYSCVPDVRDMLNDQPTAYDVEQVVKQLESIKEKEYGVCSDEDCGYCKYFSRCQDGNMADMLTLDKAIEIVKRGGRDEK